MSVLKIAFSLITLFSFSVASEEPAKVVQDFYNDLNTVKDNNNTQNDPEAVFTPILEKYLDWNQIVNSILIEPRIRINNATSADNKTKFTETLASFLESFIEPFKTAVIKKYSNADYLTKFQNVTEFKINIRQIKISEKQAEIPSSASVVTDGQTTKWNLTWKLNLTNGAWKVADLAIEGGIQIFKTEQDLAQTKFKDATQGEDESIGTYKKGLQAIARMYDFEYSNN